MVNKQTEYNASELQKLLTCEVKRGIVKLALQQIRQQYPQLFEQHTGLSVRLHYTTRRS